MDSLLIPETDEGFMCLWERYTPELMRALAYNDGAVSLDDVKLRVMQGGAQFWPVQNSVVVTEFIHYPSCLSLNIWLCAGTLNELRTVYSSIIRFAKDNSCYAVTASGRKGWVRLMHTFDSAWQQECQYKLIL